MARSGRAVAGDRPGRTVTGDVSDADRLGTDGDPYPAIDWQTTIEEYTPLPGGRATVKPRITWTARIAPGVFFSADRHRVAVGLNDPADFETPPIGDEAPDDL